MKNCIICNNELSGNQVKYCSNKCKQKAHWYNVKSQPNTYHSQTKRGIKRKLKFTELLGGKCSCCGYNKNLAVLEFHHINSNEKEFPLDIRKLANTSEDILLKELNKCILLCANCHREHHNPEMNINLIKEKLL